MVKLDRKAKTAIVEAIRFAEKETSGQIRVHIKPLCKKDVMEEAKKIFFKLKMHRTKEKNAVLVFIALKDRHFAILGDEGIHVRVRDDFWNSTRDLMASFFAKGRLTEGIVAGVIEIGERLKEFFPVKPKNSNELSDTVTEG